MNLDFCSLFSGSTGNSELVAFDDAGRTGKALDEAVRRQGFDMRMVRAILVTHEHIDHIRGVGVLARKYGMEVYASHGTWEAMADKVGEIPARRMRIFTSTRSMCCRFRFRTMRRSRRAFRLPAAAKRYRS